MTAARIKPASNFTLQWTTGSRCSPLAAERSVIPHSGQHRIPGSIRGLATPEERRNDHP